MGLNVSECLRNGPFVAEKDGKTMEHTGSNLSPDRSPASEQEGVSRRNLLTALGTRARGRFDDRRLREPRRQFRPGGAGSARS